MQRMLCHNYHLHLSKISAVSALLSASGVAMSAFELVFIDILLIESGNAAQLLSERASSRDAGGGGGQWTEERD